MTRGPFISVRSARRGFTLVELLAVMGIIAILGLLVVPNLTSVLRGSGLTRADNDVLSLLAYARQAAITDNSPMEVRIYQYADPSYPGETAGSPGTGKYRAFQIFNLANASAPIPLTPPQHLPSGIIIDSGTTLTSIFSPTATPGTVNLPGLGTNYNYQYFRLLPDGSAQFFPTATTASVTPPATPGAWCLTLHAVSAGDKLTAPPANFATIDVDAINGKVSNFRP